MHLRPRTCTALLCLALLGVLAAGARASVVSNAADDLRTGWYSDQPRLGPTVVTRSDFGQLFSTPVTGQVYAQPLVANDTLFVATEANRLYGLDPVTGAQRWTRDLGTPFSAADVPGGGCSDLRPTIGVTGTPAIDTATNTAYFFSKTYASGTSGAGAWWAHAVDVSSGAERPGFPVRIEGPAQNNPSTSFNASTQMQRPGVLLMNGVVYAAFGSHCDLSPWQGWVVGVSTTGEPKTMWTSMGSGANDSGAGIWQAGGGLMSDGPGQIVVTTGNPGAPTTPSPGGAPPANLGEAVVRLAVQADGTVRPVDFFSPYDATTLDTWDADFGSGGPMALPDSFGTAAHPHLMVAVGKQGYVYLLDRDDLGGIGQGVAGGDRVVDRKGPYGGVWSRPSAWGGDGGYVYVPTASGGDSAGGSSGFLRVYRSGVDGGGMPRLALVGTSSDDWGFGTSSPVVTSNGTQSGSGLVWVVWSPNGTGVGAELRAYDAVPSGGVPLLRRSFAVGTGAKFAPPGVSGNRVYVGTRDGHLIGFGAPAAQPLIAAPSPLDFPATTVGASSTRDVVITARETLTITALASTNPRFAFSSTSPSLPADLAAGETLRVPVTFTPTPSSPGLQAGQLNVTSSAGSLAVGLTGSGQPAGGQLTATPPLVTFEGTPLQRTATGSVTFSNTGAQPLTIRGYDPPSSPFAAAGLPAIASTLAAGASVTVDVTFAPTAAGQSTSQVGLVTSAGTVDVGLSGSAAPPPRLEVTPRSIAFGSVPAGHRVSRSFTVKNTGGTRLTFTQSKPPAGGGFAATTTLDEGATLGTNESRTETVSFAPRTAGAAAASWELVSDDGAGPQPVALSGTGVTDAGPVPDPAAGGWTLNGSATLAGGGLQLTDATQSAVGSAFWPSPQDPRRLRVAFDASIDSGTGADGLALVLGDFDAGASDEMIGGNGGGLGFAGIPGLAVALDTYQNGADPSANFVGLSDGPLAPDQTDALHWLATSSDVPPLWEATRHVEVAVTDGVMSVSVDGRVVLTRAVTLPPRVLVGFSAAEGYSTDRHAVSRVSVTSSPAPPAPPGSSPPPAPPGAPAPVPGFPASPLGRVPVVPSPSPARGASLRIMTRVLAPRGSRRRSQRFAYRGRCPGAFSVRSLVARHSFSPALRAARAGSGCSVTQSLAPGRGWATSVSVNGGRPRRLHPRGGRLNVPVFRLAPGRNTLRFTNAYTAPRRR